MSGRRPLVPLLSSGVLTLASLPGHRRAKENLLVWPSAIGASAMLAEVPHQLIRLEPDGQHRVSRLRHSALVVWRRTMSEGANGLDVFDEFHVVLVVWLNHRQSDAERLTNALHRLKWLIAVAGGVGAGWGASCAGLELAGTGLGVRR